MKELRTLLTCIGVAAIVLFVYRSMNHDHEAAVQMERQATKERKSEQADKAWACENNCMLCTLGCDGSNEQCSAACFSGSERCCLAIGEPPEPDGCGCHGADKAGTRPAGKPLFDHTASRPAAEAREPSAAEPTHRAMPDYFPGTEPAPAKGRCKWTGECPEGFHCSTPGTPEGWCLKD